MKMDDEMLSGTLQGLFTLQVMKLLVFVTTKDWFTLQVVKLLVFVTVK